MAALRLWAVSTKFQARKRFRRMRRLSSASLAGSFLTRHPLRDEPLAAAGVRVAAGQALGLIQVGDLLVPVYAPRDGVVEATLRENGALVGLRRPIVHVVRNLRRP